MSTSSKTGSILSYLSQHPNAGNKEVSEALAKKGIEVSPAYVGTIKYNASKQNGNGNGSGKAKTAKAKAPVAAKPVRSARRTPVLTTALTADQLVEAKQVVANLGGIENVRTSLETARQFINGLGSVDAAEAALATLEKLESVVPQPPTDGGGTGNKSSGAEDAGSTGATSEAPAAEVQGGGGIKNSIRMLAKKKSEPAGEVA